MIVACIIKCAINVVIMGRHMWRYSGVKRSGIKRCHQRISRGIMGGGSGGVGEENEVRLRGLRFGATENQVYDFFLGFHVNP